MNMQEVIIRDSRDSCLKYSGMLATVVGNLVYQKYFSKKSPSDRKNHFQTSLGR